MSRTCHRSQVYDIRPVTPRDGHFTGSHTAMSDSGQQLTEAQRSRRLAVLDGLRLAASQRARLRPRAEHLARERALLHARTTRG